ncbi:MAG: hypothetical protein R3330_14740, partial [Saprospiraceae bacterium]|nr:hypothetical protein [Saprospiraceae bacterium]
DGIGREDARNQQARQVRQRIPLGTCLTRERIDIISDLYQIETTVEINDLKDDDGNASGTEVVVVLPVIAVEEGRLHEQV